MLGNARPATMAGLVALVLTLAACSGAASSGDSVTSTGRDAASPTPSPAASPVETELPAAPPVDVEATPIEPRVEARLELTGGPDYLAVAAGSVWVRKDDGMVVRIDPEDTTEVATIKTSERLCQGLGADDTAVWSCTDGGVVRIDPATNEVVATVELAKFSDQGHIPVAFGRAWVLVDDGSGLVGIADDAVATEIDLGMRCYQLVASDTSLWAACLQDGVAVAVDPDSGEITTRVAGLEGARNVAVGEQEVWIGFDGGLARIDEASGRVTGVADAPSGQSGTIAATADDVWVRTGGRFLRHVDADTMEVVEDLEAPEPSGGFVLVAYDSVWATAYDDAVLYRVAPTP